MLNVPTRWRMLLVLFLARTSMAYQFQTVPSAGPEATELAADTTRSGKPIVIAMARTLFASLVSGTEALANV